LVPSHILPFFFGIHTQQLNNSSNPPSPRKIKIKTRDSDKGRKSGTIADREEEKRRLSSVSEEQ